MKKAIIIGASSGIGKALAELMVSDGYLVGITGRRIELLNEIKAKNSDRIIVKSFDNNDYENILIHLEDLVAEMGGVDVIVISSGFGAINAELDFEKEKQTIYTNILGFSVIANWAYKYFAGHKKGHLLAISSIAGIRGSRVGTAYSASKAYQINYLEGLRQRAHKEKLNVVISDIRPGFVDTDMAKGERLFWVATPEKAAEYIFRAVRKKKEIVYVTRRWKIISVILKLIPSNLYGRLQTK